MKRFLFALLFPTLLFGQTLLRRVATLEDLQQLKPSNYAPTVYVDGLNGGFFTWTAASSAATNAVDTIAQPYGAATGRYLRQVAMGGRLNFQSSADLNIDDVDTLSIDAQTAHIGGVSLLSLASSDTLLLMATTNLSIVTPAMGGWTFDDAVFTNRLLTLVDPTNGYWEAVTFDSFAVLAERTITASGGTLTIVGGYGPARTTRDVWSASGDVTLAWTGLTSGDTGTLVVYGDGTDRALTLPAYAKAPGGSPLTATANKWSVIAWENRVIGGTNVVFVNLGTYE